MVWKNLTKIICTSILSHLFDSDHTVDKNRSFNVIDFKPTTFRNMIRFSLLHIVKAVRIRTVASSGIQDVRLVLLRN